MTTQTLSAHGYRYLFGPVFSRRLGRSLGVDLLPYKTCSLDCVYCECGATTDLSSTLAEFVPVEAVLAELDAYRCTLNFELVTSATVPWDDAPHALASLDAKTVITR